VTRLVTPAAALAAADTSCLAAEMLEPDAIRLPQPLSCREPPRRHDDHREFGGCGQERCRS
ncbi:MAG: hypothetical protein ACTHMZ_05535, partial [Actinomycetes bacterium]